MIGRLFRRKPRPPGPGTVVITCGCRSSNECPQFRMFRKMGSHPKGCAIHIDELDLLRIARDVVNARFENARKQEKDVDSY
jgi:hypothetical protein